MNKNDVIPVRAWYASVGLLFVSALVAVGLLVVSLSSADDPQPVGVPVIDDQLEINRWQIASSDSGGMPQATGPDGQAQVTVQAGGGHSFGIAPYEIHPPCTLELSAVQISGQNDAGYGLWWGQSPHQPDVLVGLTGNGYMAILPGDPAVGTPVRDWQLFPHVQPLGRTNVLRVDVTRESIVVRINDEIAGQIEPARLEWLSAGYFVRSSAHGDVTIQFLRFRVWQETPSAR